MLLLLVRFKQFKQIIKLPTKTQKKKKKNRTLTIPDGPRGLPRLGVVPRDRQTDLLADCKPSIGLQINKFIDAFDKIINSLINPSINLSSRQFINKGVVPRDRQADLLTNCKQTIRLEINTVHWATNQSINWHFHSINESTH